jgi:hypothetical protein
MSQIKIILFRGGFAGDLITTLHHMNCFRELTPQGKIEIDSSLLTLQRNRNDMTIEDKDQYLNKHPIISCCDPEFALKHKNQTLMINCSNTSMASYFCKRFYQYHPHMADEISLAEYDTSFAEWSHFWSPKFKRSIDVSDIFTNDNFLSKLDIVLNDDKIKLFNDWKKINKKSFLDHKETSGR